MHWNPLFSVHNDRKYCRANTDPEEVCLRWHPCCSPSAEVSSCQPGPGCELPGAQDHVLRVAPSLSEIKWLEFAEAPLCGFELRRKARWPSRRTDHASPAWPAAARSALPAGGLLAHVRSGEAETPRPGSRPRAPGLPLGQCLHWGPGSCLQSPCLGCCSRLPCAASRAGDYCLLCAAHGVARGPPSHVTAPLHYPPALTDEPHGGCF